MQASYSLALMVSLRLLSGGGASSCAAAGDAAAAAGRQASERDVGSLWSRHCSGRGDHSKAWAGAPPFWAYRISPQDIWANPENSSVLAAALPRCIWRGGSHERLDGRRHLPVGGEAAGAAGRGHDGISRPAAGFERCRSSIARCHPYRQFSPARRHRRSRSRPAFAGAAGCRVARWIGYLSTTGVYGDRGGDWVAENSRRIPTQDRSRRRALAEDGWLTLWERDGLPVHIFRLAGIYGPGRSAIDSVRGGTAKRVVKAGQVFSRIHVDDIATVLLASMAAPIPARSTMSATTTPRRRMR